MLRPPFRMPAAVLAALAISGCGSAGDDDPVAVRSAAPAAKSTGPLKVVAVDGRLGDATTASSTEALRELPTGRRRVNPDVLKDGVGAGAVCLNQEVMPAADNLGAVVAATLCLVNGERADAGLPGLSPNAKLDQSSAAHSEDMVRASYFAHQSLDGREVTDRVRSTGYIPEDRAWTVGENLAWGTGTLATPRGIVKAWMESQGHRENILRPTFREAGLGVVLGNPRAADGQGATYTMNFGSVEGGETASVVKDLAAGTAPRSTTSASSRAAARRAAAKRRKSCRARARRARISSSEKKARIARCIRAGRSRR